MGKAKANAAAGTPPAISHHIALAASTGATPVQLSEIDKRVAVIHPNFDWAQLLPIIQIILSVLQGAGKPTGA